MSEIPSANDHLHIVICGGTFDKIYIPERGELGFTDSILPELLKRIRCERSVSLSKAMMIDSLDMTDEHREALCDHITKLEHHNILVIHGTDTMVKSAQHISRKKFQKNIVFTGAMIPARLPESEALFNLGFAMACLEHLTQGAWIAMNAKVFSPDHCLKNRDLGRFENTPK